MSCIVLKFGSSILPDQSHLPHAIHEIYRHVREGRKVVAVVSAFAGETDRLLAKAKSFGDSPDQHAIAALAATGEAHAAALLTLALDRAGVPANCVDPGAIALRTHGAPLDSDPISIHTSAIERLLADKSVLVVPGFIGRDHLNRAALLGRGGSDFSALYIAAALKCPCVLLKDVDAIYNADPAVNHNASRFTKANYDDVLGLPEGIVQHKAVRFAKQHNVPLHIGAIGKPIGTIIANHASQLGQRANENQSRPLRLALLGLGTVGKGVYEHALALPHLFSVNAIAVRDAKKHDIPPHLLAADAVSAAKNDVDIVVETLGGLHPAREAILAALERGTHVVTANKAVVSRFGDEFAAVCNRTGAKLLCGAAVGGAVPMLEVLAGRDITKIEAVINGTTNFILDRLREGVPFAQAVAKAQAAGFAEADPSADLDGIDAAHKLILLAQRVLRVPLSLDDIDRTGIRKLDVADAQQAASEGKAIRLVASLVRDGSKVRAAIAPRVLDETHPLAQAKDEHNCLIAQLATGEEITIKGPGAGRWPTAQAVLGDLFQLAHTQHAAVAVHVSN